MARRVVRKPTTEPSDLDARKATILKAVVVEHVDTAQPVGSSSVAAERRPRRLPGHGAHRDGRPRARGLPRPAPHVGRSHARPTRAIATSSIICSPASSAPAQQRQVKDFFAHVRGEVEDVLEQTSTLLSRLTSYTSVVVGAGHTPRHDLERAAGQPRRASPPARHRLLRRHRSPSTASRRLRGDTRRSDGGVAATERPAHRHHARVDASRCRRVTTPMATLVREARQRPARPDSRPSRASRSTSAVPRTSPRSSRASRPCAQVLAILEQELLVVSSGPGHPRPRASRSPSAPSTASNRSRPARSSSRRSRSMARPVGAVGLLGPTRMKYREAMAAAEVVSATSHRVTSAGADDRG